jgi:iron complex outermembrane receptor protein
MGKDNRFRGTQQMRERSRIGISQTKGSKLNPSIFLWMASTALLAIGSTGAQAEEQGSSDGLNDIIVTARRVEENLQSVPLTVNVLTPEALANKGISDLSQINNMLPNVVWENRSGSVRNKISFRGISSNETNTGIDPGIGFYVDDVYLPNGISFNQSLLDIDRIEVLKGPQGTLFGRNTIAGVVSLHTTKPSLQDLFVKGDATGGNYGLGQGRTVVNVPLSDTAAIKISGIYRHRDGFDRNIVTGKRVNGEEHYGARAQVRFEPSDAFEMLNTLAYFHDSASQDLPKCGGGPICTTANQRHVLEANAPNDTQRKSWLASSQMNWTPGDWGTFTSITSFQHLSALENQDQDSTKLELSRSGFSVPKDNSFTQEARFASPQDSKLRGVVGAFFLYEHKVSNTPQTFSANLIALGNGPTNGGNGLIGPANILTLNTQNTTSEAIFAQSSYDLTSSLTAEIGLRYSWDHKTFDFSQAVTGSNICFPLGSRAALNNCAFPRFKGVKSWGALSGTASISYRVSDQIMPYARFSRGYKSGGWNGNQLSPGTDPTVPYGPEHVNSYEIGAKLETGNHHLRVNVAAFYNDYRALQLRFQDVNTFVQFVTNAGTAWTKGAELELSWQPLRGFEFNGNLGVQDTKINSVKPSPALNGLLDKAFTFAPHVTGSFTVNYKAPVTGSLNLVLAQTTAYRSASYLDNANSVRSPGYAQINARVGVERSDGAWGLYFSGENLTNVNREVFFVGNAPFASNIGFYNPPRTFEAQLSFKL